MKHQAKQNIVVEATRFSDSPLTDGEADRGRATTSWLHHRLKRGWRRKLALALEAALADSLPDVLVLVGYCVYAFENWGTPSQWTTVAWRDEIVSEAATAAVEAMAECAGGRVGPGAVRDFVQQRIVTGVRRRHQKECSYSRHCGRVLVDIPEPQAANASRRERYLELQQALQQLTLADRRLLEDLSRG